MSKRWYVAPIIGTGTEDDPWRLDLPGRFRDTWIMPPPKVDGSPRFGFGVALVAAADHAALETQATTDNLPENLDATLGLVARNAIKTKLEARGIDSSAVVAGITWRQVLRVIGRHVLQRGDWDEALADSLIVDVA